MAKNLHSDAFCLLLGCKLTGGTHVAENYVTCPEVTSGVSEVTLSKWKWPPTSWKRPKTHLLDVFWHL